jgi:hypothetical protein
MPFDATPPLPDRRTALNDLSSLLRNPHQWPSDFKWDYWYDDTCAIGLCRRVYGDEVFWIINGHGRQMRETYLLFYDRFTRTRPTDIADSIDKYLSRTALAHKDARQLEFCL